jgi:hypothetical protein
MTTTTQPSTRDQLTAGQPASSVINGHTITITPCVGGGYTLMTVCVTRCDEWCGGFTDLDEVLAEASRVWNLINTHGSITAIENRHAALAMELQEAERQAQRPGMRCYFTAQITRLDAELDTLRSTGDRKLLGRLVADVTEFLAEGITAVVPVATAPVLPTTAPQMRRVHPSTVKARPIARGKQTTMTLPQALKIAEVGGFGGYLHRGQPRTTGCATTSTITSLADRGFGTLHTLTRDVKGTDIPAVEVRGLTIGVQGVRRAAERLRKAKYTKLADQLMASVPAQYATAA